MPLSFVAYTLMTKALRAMVMTFRYILVFTVMTACIYFVVHSVHRVQEEPLDSPDTVLHGIVLRANQGSPTAQNMLGNLYKDGKQLPRDYQKATEWYRKAAEQGFAEAEANLGLMIATSDKSDPNSDKEAAEWFRKAADQGYTHAQFALADFYARGRGLPQNFEEAARWLHIAADLGDKDAQGALGIMYFRGLGVPQDVSEAYFWIKLSGTTDKKATVFADDAVHMLTPQEIWALNKRIADWRPGVSEDHHDPVPSQVTDSGAQQLSKSTYLADSTKQSDNQPPQQRVLVIPNRDWKPDDLIKRAEQGDAESQDTLAMFYESGFHSDMPEAVKWYRKAAEQGLARAQNRLGILLSAGLGAPKDNVEAYAWLTVAGTKIPASYTARAHAEKNMTPEELKKAQALSVEYRTKYGSR